MKIGDDIILSSDHDQGRGSYFSVTDPIGEYGFLWLHFVHVLFEQNAGFHTVTVKMSSAEFQIVGTGLLPLFRAFLDQRISTIRRHDVLTPNPPPDWCVVNNVTVRVT
jgi:hypothetical protein